MALNTRRVMQYMPRLWVDLIGACHANVKFNRSFMSVIMSAKSERAWMVDFSSEQYGMLPPAHTHTHTADLRPVYCYCSRVVSCVCFVNVGTDLLPRSEVNVVSGCVG